MYYVVTMFRGGMYYVAQMSHSVHTSIHLIQHSWLETISFWTFACILLLVILLHGTSSRPLWYRWKSTPGCVTKQSVSLPLSCGNRSRTARNTWANCPPSLSIPHPQACSPVFATSSFGCMLAVCEYGQGTLRRSGHVQDVDVYQGSQRADRSQWRILKTML